VDIGVLLGTEPEREEKPVIIMVDDEKLMLRGNIPVLAKVIPDAQIIGFNKPSEAVAFVKENHVSIAFLDIEMGRVSGLDLCRELLAINPRINVIFLTAYTTYSLDAWETGASGFLMKPLTIEGVQKQLSKLRYPVPELMYL
jgi:two-component SAPR family response regulator